MKTRRMKYTKEDGSISDREVIVVSAPRENYLVYDVGNFTELEISHFLDVLEEADTYRNECLADFEKLTGIKLNSLWRSFKPGGIDWEE